MAFLIDEAYLPATLTVPPMSDQQFAQFCSEHPDLFFEMTAEGELIVMPPTFSLTGAQNSAILTQLAVWTLQDARGIASDSSTGFVLPNGARRSPDAAWTLKTEIAKLTPESRDGFWHLCPAFVIELRSKSDRIRKIREKMREYLANGAQLGWLIDPSARTVEIYRPNREPEILSSIETLQGETPVDGFVLHLSPVWNPLAG
jgi:Uma2 family endonuclease